MRQQPSWPALVAAAHTLAYDLRVAGSLPAERLATIITPTLVIDSTGSDERLHRWADWPCPGPSDALSGGSGTECPPRISQLRCGTS